VYPSIAIAAGADPVWILETSVERDRIAL